MSRSSLVLTFTLLVLGGAVVFALIQHQLTAAWPGLVAYDEAISFLEQAQEDLKERAQLSPQPSP